jgi:hypothetical protein
MEASVPETQRIVAMDVVVKGTPMHQWVMHHVDIQEWAQVVVCIKVQFQPMIEFELMIRFKGTEDPQEHICFCERH